MAEADELHRQRVLERRFQAMGLDAGLLPGGRAVVATLPLGAEPFETLEGPHVLRAARFYTVGHDRIKCMAPRVLFQLPAIRIVGCDTAAHIEERVRKAWDARLRALRDAERWLASLEVAAHAQGSPVLSLSLGLDDPQATAAVIEPGRVILPSRGPLSGQALADPSERVYEPTATSGTELAIAITVRMEALARRRRAAAPARRSAEPACDLPAPRNAATAPVLLVGSRLAAANGLHESLRLRGFDVQSVLSASAAIDAFRGRSFGLVLTDARLDRGDGIELIPALRALPGVLDLPIVLLDERASDPRRAAAKSAGACGYLAGQLDASRLATALAQIAADRKRRRFARYSYAVSVSWPDCAAPAVTAEIGRGGALVRGAVPTPPRGRFALHLPESGLTLHVDAETAYRLREGPDWSADGVGLRFARFEPGEEANWIGHLSGLASGKAEAMTRAD